MNSQYLNFQMNPSSSEFVSMAPYIYQPQNLYYLPQNDSNPTSNQYSIIQNQAQQSMMNAMVLNNLQQIQQPMIYSIPSTTTPSITQRQQPTAVQQTQTSKPMPSENDPFFIPIQGIVPPTKNADGRYECNVCNRTYTHAKHLKRHMMRHTGQKPYECAYCSAKFTRPDIRTRHALKCRLHKLKESNGGTLPDNAEASVLSSKSSKNASVKKNSHPATSAATKAIFKCAPQVPSAITAMNRAKKAAAAAAAASIASNILGSAQTKASPASSTSTSPLANPMVLSSTSSTPQQQKTSASLVPTPELKSYSDYPTPMSMSTSPSSEDNKLTAYSFPANEGISGYITPVEPQLSVFAQNVPQTALVDPELCAVDPVSMDHMYSNVNTTDSTSPATSIPPTDVFNNTYCIYNGAYNGPNQGLVMNGIGISNVNMGVPVNNMNTMLSESQPLLFPVNGMSSNMGW